MSMNRIIGSLFSGFMCKAYAAGFAVWIACEAFAALSHALNAAAASL